jgi:hypothetical protein
MPTNQTRPTPLALIITGLFLLAAGLQAADLSAVPSTPIAKKGKLLFSDNFQGPELARPWHPVVPVFSIENGALKGTQTRDQNAPAADGKPALIAHAAVEGLDIPTKDSVVECKIRFAGATMIDVEFDDRKYSGSHYGHICRALVRTNGVTIIDERDGNMRNDIYAMNTDPLKKAERAQLLKGRQVTYPVNLETNRWHDLVVETAGDAMRVVVNGKPAAFLKSSGIGHATKSKIELGVGGKSGFFDDLKVWQAESAQ